MTPQIIALLMQLGCIPMVAPRGEPMVVFICPPPAQETPVGEPPQTPAPTPNQK